MYYVNGQVVGFSMYFRCIKCYTVSRVWPSPSHSHGVSNMVANQLGLTLAASL